MQTSIFIEPTPAEEEAYQEAHFATYGYRDNTGLEHDSYEAACRYYGADTPAQLAAEAAEYEADGYIMQQDCMEARGGPEPRDALDIFGDYIPF